MERFRFGEKEANGRKATFNGWLAVWGAYPGYHEEEERCKLEVAGPNGGVRALVVMDKATAGKLGAALLKRAGAEFTGEREKRLLFMVQLFLGNLSLTIDETLKAMNQTNTGEADENYEN